jgi:hypothetical protein
MCDNPNAECVAWSPLKTATWQQLYAVLPKGVGLRIAFNDPVDPSKGVKSMVIDRKTAILTLDGKPSLTDDQLSALGKVIDGKVSLIGANQVRIDLTSFWTADLETKFEKALAQDGARVAAVTAAGHSPS